jgi:Tol biopolymer transport system component
MVMIPKLVLLPLLLAAMTPMLGCSASLRQGVNTTDAASRLEQVTRGTGEQLDPAVSPDGKMIAYESAASAGATPHVEVMALDDRRADHPAAIEYSSRDKLGLEPAWAPDGALVFQSDALGSGRLVEAIADGVQGERLLGPIGDRELSSAWPAMSPDGRSLLLSLGPVELFQTGWKSSITLDSSIGLTDLNGTSTTILGAGTDPAWSPDGRRIAFARSTEGHLHLYVAHADGTGATQITAGTEDDRQPSWSPDGRFIAYCSMRPNEHGWQQANLFVVQPDGTGLAQLTEGDSLACRPDWAKDGNIYFHANVGGHFHIYAIRPTVTDSGR